MVMEYLDDLFSPVYGNDIPTILSPNIERMAKELFLAIRNGETIFVYGDYDVDGLSCQLVWATVLKTLGARNVVHFKYTDRTHLLDKAVIQQVQATDARIILICDTGGSDDDLAVKRMLENAGYCPITIDHHSMKSYELESLNHFIFNSFEERALFDGHEISGAYASLLVAKVLCEKYFNCAVPFDAKVYALLSMYGDCVDLTSKIGRALYNSVALSPLPGPMDIIMMNKWGYMFGRRLFSYIISPQLNACFRAEDFEGLNQLLVARDRVELRNAIAKIEAAREPFSRVRDQAVRMFEIKRIGPGVILAVHEQTVETAAFHISNYTGIIAQTIAQEEKAAVIAVVHANGKYKGSYRDFYNRPLLDKFRLMLNADGHDSAFGVNFVSLKQAQTFLSVLASTLREENSVKKLVLSTNFVEDKLDINTLALYNEYRNAKGIVLLSHHVEKPRLIRATRFTKVYDVGLPITVASKTSLYDGCDLLLEPCICSEVELRGVVG